MPAEPPLPRPEDPYAPFARTLRVAAWVQMPLLRHPRAAIRRALVEAGSRDVLEVACGSGALARRLAGDGFRVVAVDRSPTMLSFARRVRGVTVQAGDAAALSFQAEFDAAVISLALHEMDPPVAAAAWDGMRRAVRPGGVLLALDYAVAPAGWLAQGMRRFIEKDERGVGRHDPAHFRNYRAFLAEGGLAAWMTARGSPPQSEQRFWRGNLAVAVAQNG